MKLKWLGHASFRIKNGKKIYIDPYKLSADEKEADIILITHDHFDHCSPEDVKQLMKEGTLVIAHPSAAAKLGDIAKPIGQNETLNVENVKVQAFPAYNLNKEFHPKGDGVGYLISHGGVSLYHAGDTDAVPEMYKVKANIVMVPVGGTYTMNATEAADAVNRINPQIAIPMHWGSIVGSATDAETFKEHCRCQVRILQPGEEIEI